MRLPPVGLLLVSAAALAVGWLAHTLLRTGSPSLASAAAVVITCGMLIAWTIARPMAGQQVMAWCAECHAGQAVWLHGFCTRCGGTRSLRTVAHAS